MSAFVERLHGYILEKLGIYDWEYAPLGKIIMSEESIEKLRDADPDSIDIYDDDAFIAEAYQHFKNRLGDFNGEMMKKIYNAVVDGCFWMGDPQRIAGFDAANSFFDCFVDGIILRKAYNVSEGENIVHLDDPTLGDEVKAMKRRYRGSLRANKQQFVNDAYSEVLEEAFFEQCCYDYGTRPYRFDVVDIKIVENDTLDVKINVDTWLTKQVCESIRYHVAEVCLKGLLKEMSVEGMNEPVWEDDDLYND